MTRMVQQTHKRPLLSMQLEKPPRLPADKIARGAASKSIAEHSDTVNSNTRHTAGALVELQSLSLGDSLLKRANAPISRPTHHASRFTFSFNKGKILVFQVVQSVVEAHPLASYRIANQDVLWMQKRDLPYTSLGIMMCDVERLAVDSPALLLSLLEGEKRVVEQLFMESLSSLDVLASLTVIAVYMESLLDHIHKVCRMSRWRFGIASQGVIDKRFSRLKGACITAYTRLSHHSNRVDRHGMTRFFEDFRSGESETAYLAIIHQAQLSYGQKAYRLAVNQAVQARDDTGNDSVQANQQQQLLLQNARMERQNTKKMMASQLLLSHHIYLLYVAILDRLYVRWTRDDTVDE